MRAGLIVLVAASAVAGGPKPGSEGTSEYQEVTDLVEQLGALRFATRKAAAKKLLEMGDPAVPALTAGAGSTDVESPRPVNRPPWAG